MSKLQALSDLIHRPVIKVGGAVLILVLLAFGMYRNSIHEFPAHTHAWSQSDRYAISLGFLRNGFDFFHPETYNLNPQFPAKKPLEEEQGITRVDFPVHDFLVSVLMKLFGTEAPGVFRMYILIYSLVGLLFLFMLSQEMGAGFFGGALVLVFAFSAPVFTYYQAGFLPTIPSLANLFIGACFLFRYTSRNHGGLSGTSRGGFSTSGGFVRRNRFWPSSGAGASAVGRSGRKPSKWGNRHFNLAVLFMTLAALSRTPFAIFLIALAGVTVLGWWRRRAWMRHEFVSLALGFLAVGGYYLYNTWLGSTYGSVFLGRPQPPASVAELGELAGMVWENWSLEYFTVWHYALMGLLAVIGLVLGIRFRFWRQSRSQQAVRNPAGLAPGSWGLWLGIASLGVFAYMGLMARQFPAHDYYFLDTLFPLLLLALVALLGWIGRRWRYGRLLGFAALFLAIGMIPASQVVQAERRTFKPWDGREVMRMKFQESEPLLDSLGVSPDARIFVPDAYAPNLPFILMDRKGYALLSTRRERLDSALTHFRYDYVVLRDSSMQVEILNAYPDIAGRLEWIGGNGDISVYMRADTSEGLQAGKFWGGGKGGRRMQAGAGDEGIPGKGAGEEGHEISRNEEPVEDGGSSGKSLAGDEAVRLKKMPAEALFFERVVLEVVPEVADSGVMKDDSVTWVSHYLQDVPADKEFAGEWIMALRRLENTLLRKPALEQNWSGQLGLVVQGFLTPWDVLEGLWVVVAVDVDGVNRLYQRKKLDFYLQQFQERFVSVPFEVPVGDSSLVGGVMKVYLWNECGGGYRVRDWGVGGYVGRFPVQLRK